MSLIVQKYGGTSVGDTERIKNVARRLLACQLGENKVVGVISAMSGETNRLTALAQSIGDNPSEREMDVLLSTGEQVAVSLVAMAVNELGGKAISLTGAQAGISTNSIHTKAKIENIDPSYVLQLLEMGVLPIVAGFQGIEANHQVTTLGRGGSDLTAIAMAAALNADLCQIFTDVDGVYTCDPRVVPNARKIHEISYDELLEMASSGTKVMQSRSVEFAKKFGVCFEVRNSQNDSPGTIVTEEHFAMEAVVIRGVSLERSQAQITLAQIPDQPGIASRVFDAIAESDIIVDMIVQNVSVTGTADISFTLAESELQKALRALEPLVASLPGDVRLESHTGIAKLSVVGIGMRSHSGVASKMFSALAEAGINIRMISTSEIKTAVIIDEDLIELGANTVHAAFGLENEITTV